MQTLSDIQDALCCGRSGCPCQKLSGGELHTHCPAHDDRVPSLHIKESTGGKLLVHCHANCLQEAVLAELKARDLWPSASTPKSQNTQKPAWEIAAIYEYTDANGDLLYQAVRYKPKVFRQRRPDGKDGWIWNLNGVSRVPYRLPDVLAAVAAGKPIFVVEGEKDVETLVARGWHATCNSGGADKEGGDKWGQDCTEALRGASVYILPDNDKPGRAHAEKVARALYGTAKKIKIVDLPGLPEKGDVSDFLAGVGTLTRLKTLAKEAPDWTPDREGMSGAVPAVVKMPMPEANTEYPVTSEDGWEPPVPFTASRLPLFPLNALPSALADHAAEVAATMQVPPDMPALMALGVVAAAAARSCQVKVGKTHSEPLNLFVAVVMEPGSRKSAALDAMAAPLLEAERDLSAANAAAIAGARETQDIEKKRLAYLREQAAKEKDAARRDELTREVSALAACPTEVPAPVRLLADDVTPEKLADLMADQNGTLAIASAEGGIFGTLAGRYSQSGTANLDLFLKGHAGESYRVDRKGGEGAFIRRACLTMLLAVQPDVLQSLADTPTFRGRGLLGRFLYGLPESLVGTRLYRDRPIDPRARARYEWAVRVVIDLPSPATEADPGARHVLRIDGAALDVWARQANDIETRQAEGGDLAGIRDWASKLAGAVARIAGGLHMIESAGRGFPWGAPITPETIAAAWAIGEYLIPHALAAFSHMGADPNAALARRLLRWIERKRLSEFTLRDCHQAHRSVGSPKELEPALTLLCERGYLRPKEAEARSGRGQPKSPTYEVNPHTQNTRESPN